MMSNALFSSDIVRALGWSLLHSLWQGALLAVVLGLLLIGMRTFSSATRYIVVALGMALLAVTLPVNFVHQYQREPAAVFHSAPATAVQPAVVPELPGRASAVAGSAKAAGNITSFFVTYFEPHLPLLVTCWLLGMLILLLRYLGQIAYLQRLQHHRIQPFPGQWHGMIGQLQSRLNISRRVRYLESPNVHVPMTLGWLKPVVLFPIGLAARLTPAEVEFILLHELAHIRRNDYLVNILQSLVSILFFYHPAAWWLSKLLAEEREKCCDDMVVAQLGQPAQYATTLIHLQEQKLKTLQPALAVTGPRSGFSRRIVRLLNDSATATNRFREGFVTAFVLIAGLGFLAVAGNKTASVSASEGSTMIRSVIEKENLDRLIGAIAAEDELLFLDLLKQGVNVNGIGAEGWTPLAFAAAERQVHFARLLLNAGADANVPLPFTGTPLIIAAREGDLQMAALLLERGADVNLSSTGDGNPLIAAAAEGHAPVVRLLVERGADVNALVEGDETPLINAAGNGHLEVVQYLVAHGADVNLSVLANPNSRPEQRTPLNQAIKHSHSAVAAYLRTKGAKR